MKKERELILEYSLSYLSGLEFDFMLLYVILQSPRSPVPQTTSDGIDDINLLAVPRRHTDKRLPSLSRGRGEYSMSGRRNEVFKDPEESGQ